MQTLQLLARRREATLIVELLEGLELIGRVHAGTDDVLGQADLRRVAVGLHEARDRFGLLDPLPFREELEGLAPALAGGDEIPACCAAFTVQLRFGNQRLEQPMRRDACGELLEPDIRTGLAGIGRRALQLAQRNVHHAGRGGCGDRCAAVTGMATWLRDLIHLCGLPLGFDDLVVCRCRVHHSLLMHCASVEPFRRWPMRKRPGPL
jgi:hypothetical protein